MCHQSLFLLFLALFVGVVLSHSSHSFYSFRPFLIEYKNSSLESRAYTKKRRAEYIWKTTIDYVLARRMTRADDGPVFFCHKPIWIKG